MKLDVTLRRLALGVSLLGAGPVLPHLDLPLAVLLVGALALGPFTSRAHRFLPDLPATLLTFAGIGLYALQLNLDNPVRPLVHMLVILLALRQLTEPTGRHLLQIFILSLILLSGSSLLSLSVWFLPALVAQVVLISLGLVLLAFFQRAPDLELARADGYRLWRTAIWLPAGALLLMVVFFFVLPRTRTPLWDRLNQPDIARTGYSEQVAAGENSAVIASSGVVFRAEMRPVRSEDLYWRGTVLNRFDGRVWSRGQGEQMRERVSGGAPIQLTLYQRPGESSVLFTLDRPMSIEGQHIRQRGGQVYTPSKRAGKRRLAVVQHSRLGGKLAPVRRMDAARYLQLPPEVAPRLRQLAGRLDPAASPEQRLANLTDFYRRQKLRYATKDLPAGEYPLASFLFDRKQGHCEFFASSFALLLRLQGIPSRVVGGFYGGEYNELGGYYLVRENMAHAWVEAWLPERGWLRLDPTTLAGNAGEVLVGPRTATPPLLTRLLDTVNYLWNRQVITYDLERQIQSARSLRQFSRGYRTPLRWAAGMVAGGVLLALLWRRRPRANRPTRDPARRLYRRVLRRLRLREEDLPPGMGLSKLAHYHPDPALVEFLQRYQRHLYRDEPWTPALQRHLRQLAGRVQRPKQPKTKT